MTARGKKKVAESQGSLFEKDFLLRTLGDHVRVPDVALSELVANAWDAGAGRVEIDIPEKRDQLLTVGLTEAPAVTEFVPIYRSSFR